MSYDIIGDIHGHADALTALLKNMGYQRINNAWCHTERKAIFVGDFVDRGPKQIETVDIVRRMVEAGSAEAVMGNHEFNAIAWYLPDPNQPGEFLRPHHSAKYGNKNYSQHKAFLDEVNGTPHHKEIIDWFMTLPLWLELEGIRVVHGCWHQAFMNYLAPQLASGNRLTEELMVLASQEPENDADKDTAIPTVFKAVEALTKGIEIPLPAPHTFKDKDGHERDRVRTRWWDASAINYKQTAMLDDALRNQLPEDLIPEHARVGHDGGTPVFFGHYWLNGDPALLSDKVACVDYSVAKGGKLVAYRWDGESVLSQKNFISAL
jgi:hypothetical protein